MEGLRSISSQDNNRYVSTDPLARTLPLLHEARACGKVPCFMFHIQGFQAVLSLSFMAPSASSYLITEFPLPLLLGNFSEQFLPLAWGSAPASEAGLLSADAGSDR